MRVLRSLNDQRAILLALPLLAFLAVFFIYPAMKLLLFSIETQNSLGIIGPPFTVGNYWHFLQVGLYMRVFWTTMRIAFWTATLAILCGYPIALVMARGSAWVARIVSLVVIAPLIISVVVRSYGWQIILMNSSNGMLNGLLLKLGLITAPLALLYTPAAVIIGELHVNLPMMVLPLASALGRIDPNLEDSARVLGASWLRVFWRITLPLSLPGVIAGFVLVFSLTAGSYVGPVILGGATGTMLGNLIEQQIFAVFDWPFGAAIAFVLVMVVLLINGLSLGFLDRRLAGARRS